MVLPRPRAPATRLASRPARRVAGVAAIGWIVTLAAGGAPSTGSPPAQQRLVWADSDTNALGAPSPDGRYLSFVDSSGNLAIRDLTGGSSRTLTADAGGPPPGQFAYFSIFSRDSRRIAYAWFNEQGFYELRILDINGGEPKTLYRNPEAGFVQPTAFSPRGDEILTLLFRRDNVSQIAVVSAHDGSARVLRSLDWFYPKKIDLSPDGRFVVFDSIDAAESAARDIHILALDGSHHGRLTDSPANDLFPLWTPDGKGVVFGSDRDGSMDAWMVPVEDGKPVAQPVKVKRDLGRALPMAFTDDWRLFYGLRAGRSEVFVFPFDPGSGAVGDDTAALASRFSGGNRGPEWSPDGRFLAYLSRVGTENYGQEHRVVTIREVATGREAVHSPRLAFIERLRWSPHGQSLLLSGSDAQGRSGLFVLDLDSGEAQRAVVARGGGFRGLEGDWSADGQRIYVARPAGSERFEIRSYDPESGQDDPVYQPPPGRAVIRHVRRAAGSDTLAFVLGVGADGGDLSLQVLDVQTGQARTVLRSRFGSISGIEWLPGGDSILVAAEAPQASSLWLAPSSGASDPRLLETPWKRPGPVRVSPDGQWVSFSHEEPKAEVWALDDLPRPQ